MTKHSELTALEMARIILSDLVSGERKFDMRAHREKGSNALDFMMPNGKKLGDCTGAEARRAGEAWESLRTIWIKRMTFPKRAQPKDQRQRVRP